MKNKIIAYAILAAVFLFPFRNAFLDAHKTDIIWILNFLMVVAGMLLFFMLTISDPEKEKS